MIIIFNIISFQTLLNIPNLKVSESGVHIPPVAGIHGRENDCAYSIVLSGGYGDIDNGNEFIYTGSGGRTIAGMYILFLSKNLLF